MKLQFNLSDLKVVETGATDARFALWCRDHYRNNPLLVCKGSNTQFSCKDSFNIYTAKDDKQLFLTTRCNNADFLVLSGRSQLYLWKYKSIRHVDWVAFTPSLSITGLWSFMGWMLQTLVLRYRSPRLVLFNTKLGFRFLVISKMRTKRKKSPRRYIPFCLLGNNFFTKLNQADIKYVVLRWFENLPIALIEEDIDFLVSTKDIKAVENILGSGPGIHPIDLYSTDGVEGTDFLKMPYYPPKKAREILDNSVLFEGLYRIPNELYQFYSLVFHALYHKGFKSGLKKEGKARGSTTEHDHNYHSSLSRLLPLLNLRVELVLEELDDLMSKVGWRPPIDNLAKLSTQNIWLKERIESELQNSRCVKGLSCFAIRDSSKHLKSEIISSLEKAGFEILKTKNLSNDEISKCSEQIRGGNWNISSESAQFDPPSVAIAALSLLPVNPSSRVLMKYPHLADERILVKDFLRHKFGYLLPCGHKNLVIHSADNPVEANHYIEIFFGAESSDILLNAVNLMERFRTNEIVHEDLTRNGNNSKIEVISYENSLVVAKTFLPSKKYILEREVYAIRELSQYTRSVPELVDVQDCRVLFRYYDDTLRFNRREGRLYPLNTGLQAIQILRELWVQGWVHMDAHPENFIFDRNEGLKLLDFEYCIPYKSKPTSFADSWDLIGYPNSFTGDAPRGPAVSYNRCWKPHLGLSLQTALYGSWLRIFLEYNVSRILSAPKLLLRRIRYHLKLKGKKG